MGVLPAYPRALPRPSLGLPSAFPAPTRTPILSGVDDDRQPGALPDAGGDWIANIVIPDDARELEQDVAAYRRELRRQNARPGLLTTLARRPFGTSMGLLLVVLLVIGGVGLFLDFVQPGASTSPVPPDPLAATSASPLHGGLLPDVTILLRDGSAAGRGRPVAARQLRPAVLALVPTRCRCQPVVNDLAAGAASYQVALYVVGPSPTDGEVTGLAANAGSGNDIPADDSSGSLRTTFRASGVTVVVVKSNGQVAFVLPDWTKAQRLDGYLIQALGVTQTGS
jgi:hypothetical protein